MANNDMDTNMEVDDDIDGLTDQFNNQSLKSETIVEHYYKIYGDYTFSYDILEIMYYHIYGEETAFNMTKKDIINCINEYYKE